MQLIHNAAYLFRQLVIADMYFHFAVFTVDLGFDLHLYTPQSSDGTAVRITLRV